MFIQAGTYDTEGIVKEVEAMGSMSGLVYLLVVVAIIWLFMIRPQQQQAKKRAEMLTSLKVGDKIVTIGGICGVIQRITDDKIFIEIADGIVIEMLRNSISTIDAEEDLSNPFEEDEDDEDDDIYYDDDEEDGIQLDETKKEN